MRRWLVVLAIVLATLGITNILYSWTGSEQRIEIVLRFPTDNTADDTDILAVPVKVGAIQKNTSQGIAHGTYYWFEDVNDDSVVDTDEWAARIQIPAGRVVDDINQDTAFVLGWLDGTKLTQGKKYFIIGVGVDLSDLASCDTSLLVGETSAGGGASGITDKAIRRFTAQGRRP